jgi:hypothetical protein
MLTARWVKLLRVKPVLRVLKNSKESKDNILSKQQRISKTSYNLKYQIETNTTNLKLTIPL